MASKFVTLLVTTVWGVGFTLPLTAETFVAPKHLLMIKPGVDKLYGNYVFAVVNTGSEATEYTVPVSLPEEAEDFAVEEGATQADIVLGKDGGLSINKSFNPGTNLISFRFFANVSGPQGVLTFAPKVDVGNLTVLADKRSLKVSAPGLEPTENTLGGEDLSAAVLDAGLAAGNKLLLNVDGIPAGRGFLWILGWIFGVVLVIAVIVLTMLTLPQPDEDDQGELLVGEG